MYNLDEKNEGFAKDFVRVIKSKKNFLSSYRFIYLYPYFFEKVVNLSQTSNEINRSLEQMRAIDNKMKIKVVKLKNNPPSVDTIRGP